MIFWFTCSFEFLFKKKIIDDIVSMIRSKLRRPVSRLIKPGDVTKEF